MRLMTPPSPTRFRTPFESSADGATVPYEWRRFPSASNGQVSATPLRRAVGSGSTARVSVEPYVGVELLRQCRVGVVALALGIRPVDDADEALQPLLAAGGAARRRRRAGRAGNARRRCRGTAARTLSARDGCTASPPSSPSQSVAAATVPLWVPKPISAASSPKRSRHELAEVELVAHPAHVGERASPMWQLCAQTTALASGRDARAGAASVSNMCRSRRFQLSAPP